MSMISNKIHERQFEDNNAENTNRPTDVSLRQRLLNRLDGHTYMDILLMNNIDDINAAISELLSLYERLFEYGMFLSGFQFVGLVVDNKPIGFREELAYFLLGLGFFSSIFAALLAFISIEFFKSMRNEDPEMVVEGCMRYKSFFHLADVTLFIDTGLFLLSLNIVVYSVVRIYFAVALNVIAGILVVFLACGHFIVVIKRQKYLLPDGRQLKRKIYTDRSR